ncbi:hypothetical protein C8J57DRAFT_1356657 [Mycena rebaudengoi]|nr:hypothetical protein C8J57DRAFT_1356657 [Mycena rebaudengoi]
MPHPTQCRAKVQPGKPCHWLLRVARTRAHHREYDPHTRRPCQERVGCTRGHETTRLSRASTPTPCAQRPTTVYMTLLPRCLTPYSTPAARPHPSSAKASAQPACPWPTLVWIDIARVGSTPASPSGAPRRSRAPHAGGSERPAGAPSPQAHAVGKHILATVAPAHAIPAGSQKCACGGGEHRRPLRRPQRCLLTHAHTRSRTCATSICGKPAPAIPASSTKKMTRTQVRRSVGRTMREGGRRKSSQEAAVGAEKSVYTAVRS